MSAPFNCGTCVFFNQFTTPAHITRPTYHNGQCRARAPFVDLKNGDGPKTMWPFVRSTDWCGEHSVVEDKE